MKQSVFTLCLLMLTSFAHAGWLVGSDSLEEGAVRVSRQAYTNDIVIEKCDYIGSESCQEIAVRGNLSIFLSKRINNLQTTGAVIGNILPAAFGVTGAAGALGAGVAYAGAKAGIMISVGAIGTKLVSKLKVVNVIRVHDFAKAFNDDFIDDEKSVIAFPDDTVEEIIYELI